MAEQGTEQESEVVEHQGQVDPHDLGKRIEAWLDEKGFETRTIDDEHTILVKAHTKSGWKRRVGASPSLEVEIATTPDGVKVDVRPGGEGGGATLAARYLTYSWVASGFSYVALKTELVRFVREQLGSGDPAPAQPQAKILEVVETKRSEVPLGTDERTIDNSGSHAEVTRTIKATKTWKQTLEVQVEKSQVKSEGADITLVPDLLSLKADMENTVRNQYDASTEVNQTYEEDVTITVPANTCIKFSMDWKRLVQEGNVRLEDADGHTIEVPFEIAVGVTFDQRQVET